MANMPTSRVQFTDTIKNEFKGETATAKTYSILFDDGKIVTGSNVHSSGFDFTESLFSGDHLDLSAVEIPTLKFTLLNLQQEYTNLLGKQFTLTCTVSGTEVPLGTWTITDAKRNNDDLYEITAEGLLGKFKKDVTEWWTQVQTPITVRNLLISLCNYVGADYDFPEDFTNATLNIGQKGVSGESGAMTGIEMLGYIQEVACAFFKMTRLRGNGKVLTMIRLQDTGAVEEYDGTLMKSIEIADYETTVINQVQVKGSTSDVGAIVGEGTNAWTIEGNPLLYVFGAVELKQIATTIFNEISGFKYRPVDLNAKGLPYVECGDWIKITTPEGMAVQTIVTNRTMSGAQDYDDKIVIKGKRDRIAVQTRNKKLQIINQKLHEVVNTVDEFSSRVAVIDEKVGTFDTRISQTSDKVNIVAAQTGLYNMLMNAQFDERLNMKNWEWKSNLSNFPFTVVDDIDFKNGYALRFNCVLGAGKYAMLNQNFNPLPKANNWLHIHLDYKVNSSTLTKDGKQGWKICLCIQYEGDDREYKYFEDFISGDPGVLSSYRGTYQVKNKQVIAAYIGLFQDFGNSYDIEVNNILVYQKADAQLAPYGTFTSLTRDLVSQINVSPDGVKISGDKIDLASAKIKFGVDPNTVLMHNNAAKTGVSFDGSGTIDFATKGRYTANNVNVESGALGSQIGMFNSGEKNTLAITNCNGTKPGNQLQMVGGDSRWGNYMRLTDSDYSSGDWANTLYWYSSPSSYNAFFLENYEADSNQKIANRVLLRSRTDGNSLQLQNYQHGTGTVVNSMITMSDTITYMCQNWHDFQFRGDDRRFRVGGYDGFSGDVTVKDWSGSKNVKLVFHYGIMTGWYYV